MRPKPADRKFQSCAVEALIVRVGWQIADPKLAMLFLHSPGGLSHHPDETVREEDIEAALATLLNLLLHLHPHSH